ncbi:MAG: class I SAM-dependent DNA methyltransferase [Cyclobacteriaceae bacterium]|nr:class I SAM-dependent DNA methyltransferase [Cyclobacteriaceae bacterium]
MKLHILKPRKALNKAFLKVKPNRSDIERFKSQFRLLLQGINESESEEYHKNLLTTFFNESWYKQKHYINTKGRNDLVIHNGQDAKSPVGVILETKKPSNKNEMISPGKVNTKAFHELVLYYLRERVQHNNIEIKHLVITNLHEWYIFDVAVFDRLFAQNKTLAKQFADFEAGRLADTKTDFFYRQIAEPFIAQLDTEVECTLVQLADYEKALHSDNRSDDNLLIALYKLLSPEHLLKLPFANDSNSLDRRFYTELLHIIGLEESKEGGKKVIGRKNEGDRDSGSLLEDTIIQLDSLDKISRLNKPSQFGSSHPERLFNVALELCITWINRILFLKLLEAQLLSYHRHGGDDRNDSRTATRSDGSYAFLKLGKIKNYDDLNSLFFQVLARLPEERHPDVRDTFSKVPYLNSSLFEPTDIEHDTLFISNLKDDKKLSLHPQTVLKDGQGRKLNGTLNSLEYLFRFLDAYDFSSEGSEEIQEDNKTLINASVLGLIFEKINGYKDGSFFTPGFITMYMCRETLRKAVVQKFNEVKGWQCNNLEELYDKIEDRREANEIVNSLKVCDPAVGSGHFLVSALNELIAIKNDLKILQDRHGRRLKEYHVEVVNDELVVTDEDGEFFEYRPGNRESQRIQETLFHEKQTLIENCLFGVDINPNSVKICRLRLWIELLKSAYYREKQAATRNSSPVCYAGDEDVRESYRYPGTDGSINHRSLETLPNIDINIKCGNSLVSRFAIDADLKQALKKSNWNIESYKIAVQTYRNAKSKEEKRDMESLILKIKQGFSTEIRMNDPLKKRLDKLANELYHRFTGTFLFEPEPSYGKGSRDLEKKRKAEQKKLEDEIEKINAKIEEIKTNKIFENAFEWRFEFPEVLDNHGNFVGFDVVIGNPPYIRQEEFSHVKPYLQSAYGTFAGTADLYVYFIDLGMKLLREGGDFIFIVPNKWMRAGYGKNLRTFIKNHTIEKILDFGDLPVFEEATTYPCILQLCKSKARDLFEAANISTLNFVKGLEHYVSKNKIDVLTSELQDQGWTLSDSRVQKLLQKIRSKGKPLSEYVGGKIFRGVLTGLNEAFVIDAITRDRLIAEDPRSAEIIKPYLAGRDIKRYQRPKVEKYLILFKNGQTNEILGQKFAEREALHKMKELFPSIMRHLLNFETKAKARYDQGQYWWELRACDYYEEFERSKIIIPAITRWASYAYDTWKYYSNDKTSIIPTEDLYLLGLLNSNVVDFYLKSIASTKQNGYFEYKPVYVSQLPIYVPDRVTQEKIHALVSEIVVQDRSQNTAGIKGLENQIDCLVYVLYGLTEEEIEMVEG